MAEKTARLHVARDACKQLQRSFTILTSDQRKKAASSPQMDGSIVFARLHQCALHVTHASLDPPELTSQTTSLDQFSRFCTAHDRVSLYFTMGRPFPPQNCPFAWGIWTPSNTWFLGPTRVHNPNGTLIGSAIFARLATVTDRPSDGQTTVIRL